MISISSFEKINSTKSSPEKYLLKEKNYEALFFSSKLNLYSIQNITSKDSESKGILKRIKDSLFNTKVSKENIISDSSYLNFYFNNCNLEKLYTNEPTDLIYHNLYENIDLVYSIKDTILEATFILKENANPMDISISFDGNCKITLDKNKNLEINDFNIIINKPVFKNTDINFILEDNTVTLELQNPILTDIQPSSDSGDNSESSDNIESNSMDFSILEADLEPIAEIADIGYSEKYFVGTRHLLIPVEKSKFSYPFSKSTSLICYDNLPIIEDLYLANNIVKYPSSVPGICPNKNVPAFISYKSTSLTPYISYSIGLYSIKVDQNGAPISDINKLNPNIIKTINNVDNVDIYALQSDSFLGDEFDLCNILNDSTLKPVDFLVDIENEFIVAPVDTTDDCYLYDITVNVSLYKAPPIMIPPEDTGTQKALNIALGRPIDSTEPFTPGELQSITVLEFASNSIVDVSIFKYTPNLIELYMPSCNLDNTNTYFLQILTSLEILDLSGNTISDLTILKPLTNLTSLNISGNNISDLSPLSVLVNLTTLNASSTPSPTFRSLLSALTNKIVSVEPIGSLVNLVELNLSGNDIVDITPLSNLLKLDILDISSNKISNISSLNVLTHLTYFNAQNQVVDLPTLSPIVDYDFILDLALLQDIDSATPCIDSASNNGHCSSADSCDCVSLVWENILVNTNAYFDFSHEIIGSDISNFSGRVNVFLQVTPLTI